MARLFVHVEGETEETFVNDVLRPHLVGFGYSLVSAKLLGNARQRDRRGGIRGWTAARSDIVRHLREDPGRFSTTMVDYYALPTVGLNAWPGREAANALTHPQKAPTVQNALLADIGHAMGSTFDVRRFVPFVMMHEFEGLLFSDCDSFSRAIGRPALAPQFRNIRAAFESPEEINDSPLTAPSKRILGLAPEYQKPLMGTLAVLEIGLDAIRRECPHFRAWLECLERLPEIH